MRAIPRTGLTLLGGFWLTMACGPRVWEPAPVAEGSTPPAGEEDQFLRGHLQAGGLVVLESWSRVGAGDTHVTGQGRRFDAADALVAKGTLTVPLDSVVLWAVESPERAGVFPTTLLGMYTGLWGFVTAACLADPKSCFGSCPTFYAEGPGGETLVAEGFSSSFARVLEARDVDALPRDAVVRGREFSLVMRNEAPETHAVRTARLLVAPRPSDGAVLATPEGRLRIVREPVAARACMAPARVGAENCLADVGARDDREYHAPAHPSDLAIRETMDLVFDLPASRATDEDWGLVLEARHSLVSTFVFYQGIAWLGRQAESWLATLERGHPEIIERSLGPARALGDVEILVERDGGWTPAGRFDEQGPIAADAQVIPLGTLNADRVRIRLRMAQGNWRIGHASLVRLGEAVDPLVVEPSRVETLAGPLDGGDALEALLDPDRHLVTARGDAYRLVYELPAGGADVDAFLESRGYYYEWMRAEWLVEEDPVLASLLFTDPPSALRRMAPAFKAREADMEADFWSSRFRRER